MSRLTNEGALRLQKFLAERDTLSAAELARRCEMMPQQLNHLVKGRRIPTLEQAFKLNVHARIPYADWLMPTARKG